MILGKSALERHGGPKMSPGARFRNAGRKHIHHGLEYVEGYVSVKGFGLVHAWNIDSKGPVDFTSGWGPEYEYLGLIIPNDAYLELMTAMGLKYWGSVLEYLAYRAPAELLDRVIPKIAEANPVSDMNWDAVCSAL